MNTLDMVEPMNRAAAVAEWNEWLVDNKFPLNGLHAARVGHAALNPINGHIVASNLEYFRKQDQYDSEQARIAVDTLCLASLGSSRYYLRDFDFARPQGWDESDEFRDNLRSMQRNMAEGVIDLLPPQFAMTVAEGRKQVTTANDLLGMRLPQTGRMLSDANYSLYFTNRTMATGAALLKTSIPEAVESDAEEQMPHLTRTNLAIGQMVQGLAERAKGELTVIDTGSGTGATLAAVVAGVGEAADRANIDHVSITGIESNPDFFRSLRDFAGRAIAELSQYGPTFNLETTPDLVELADGGKFNLIEGDILNIVESLTYLPRAEQDTTVITANYVWHRLPDQTKIQIIKQIDKLAPNSIFLIADLRENSSEVNRRYFNFGNNGPLNCGNLQLAELLRKQNYRVKDLADGNAPRDIHPLLASKIAAEAGNDGHMWIAYKGDEAARLLDVA